MDATHSGVADELAAVAPGARAPAPGDVLARLPVRAAVAYAGVATAWIVGSDLLVAVARDVPLADRLPEIAKGLLFVAATAAVLLTVLRLVTQRFDRLFLQTLTAQRDFYGSVLSTSSDMITIFGVDGRVVWVSDAVADLLGWRPEELVGAPGRDLVHPDDRAAALGFRESVGAGTAQSARTFLLQHRDGSARAMEVNAAPIRLADGEQGVVCNARDVTDRDRSERQLRAALAEDVTGLPGLRVLVAELDAIHELGPDEIVATVGLVDVERFGDVNQLHGRAGGDEVLRELAGRIEAAVPEALGVWRHGADEFAVVLIDHGAEATVAPHALAERLHAVVGAPIVVDEESDRAVVDLSVGIARVAVDRRGGAPLGAALVGAAEAALAEAKRHPDRVAVRMEGPASRRPEAEARLVAELHEAIERGELVVHYQPKVRLGDLRAAGMEALVRWQHPTRGLLPPSAFLATAAEANLSGSLLRVVLDDALQQVRAWSALEGCHPDLAVCVNVSADDLRRRRFVEDVFGSLDDSGVEPRRLVLELTEQTMLADALSARAVVDRLREDGIRVAIDDFGTGYSTLEHIRVFEVDEIKIDRRFVQQLGASPPDEAIVDSVLAITQRLGVSVVAEGIEHRTALSYLQERGCGLGQGYLLSRPVPAADIDPCRRWEPSC